MAHMSQINDINEQQNRARLGKLGILYLLTSNLARIPLELDLQNLLVATPVIRGPASGICLLQLPVEIICLFRDYLPDYTKLLFSQTCRALRNIYGDEDAVARKTEHSVEDRFNFLTDLCRSDPTCIVKDTPFVVIHSTVPRVN
jgi:hypothetical protein